MVLSHIKAGKLRPLAVRTAKRSLALPDVPSLYEAGLKGFDQGTWFGVLASCGCSLSKKRVHDLSHLSIDMTPGAALLVRVTSNRMHVGIDDFFPPITKESATHRRL